jgi:phosphonate transport system ATP-binding protein
VTAPGTRAAVECPAASPAELEIRGLSKRFGGIPVLSEVSLEVGKAEAVALIGANGAGKSTLLRACLRLVEPDA